MTNQHICTLVLVLAIAMVLFPVDSGYASGTKGATVIERISPEEARTKVLADEALLVCSYGDGKCKNMLPEGALLRSEFEQKLPSLSKNREIIFY